MKLDIAVVSGCGRRVRTTGAGASTFAETVALLEQGVKQRPTS